MRNAGNWKQHYFTHASGGDKPHKCSHCPKSFIRGDQLRKHEAKEHSNAGTFLKSETKFKTEFIKTETL